MPPKDGKKKLSRKKGPEGPTPQELSEAVRAGSAQTYDGSIIKRMDAVLVVWSKALENEDMREELFKAGVGPALVALVERGEPEERANAVGALSALVRSEKHYTEVLNAKVLAAATALLGSEHLRWKLPAANLLCFAASRAEFTARVADTAIVPLVQVIKSEGSPGWGQMRQAQRVAAQAIKTLIENVEGEPVEQKMLRRVLVVELGAVPALMRMVSYAPRMPLPPVVPAPPPILGKKKSSSKSKDKKGPMALGTKDTAATIAAACLRFLSLTPHFVNVFLRSGLLPEFVQSLYVAGDEQAAYLAGVLWEISGEEAVRVMAVEAGAVPALLHIISTNLAAAYAGKKVKKVVKETKDAKDTKRRAAEASAPDLPCFPDIAVCNAAGALQHLTFLDVAKQQVAACGGAPILTTCLKLNNAQTYENATGVLWNVGLDVRNKVMLMAAGAPGFLSQPVPAQWLSRTTDDGARPLHLPPITLRDTGASEGATFMTQASLGALRIL